MGRRLKVLLSAYACEPGKGSEPEVGWQWALQMARLHDVTVLTRQNNRPAIESALNGSQDPGTLPRFVFHDESEHILGLKRLFGAPRLYYRIWQRGAKRMIADMLQRESFDLLHHVTFAAFRYPIAITGHGVPSIWGPVGGIESIPTPLLPWRYPGQLTAELYRNLANSLSAKALTATRKFARQCSMVLASTHEMERVLRNWNVPTRLMPTIGLDASTPAPPVLSPPSGPLRLLFVGNLIPWKGFDLALEALKYSQTTAQFTLIGSGPFLSESKKLAARLGLQSRVRIRGRISREETLSAYKEFNVLLFPSLHDSGGYAVIEAMSFGLPVICMDIGGPQMAVDESCGIRVPPGPRREVVAKLAEAIRNYDQNRSLIIEHGRRAHAVITSNYDWKKKASRMDEFYREVVEQKI